MVKDKEVEHLTRRCWKTNEILTNCRSKSTDCAKLTTKFFSCQLSNESKKDFQYRETPELNTNYSDLVLHNLLGPVKFAAKYPGIGTPLYLAHTSINSLAVTEPSPNCKKYGHWFDFIQVVGLEGMYSNLGNS